MWEEQQAGGAAAHSARLCEQHSFLNTKTLHASLHQHECYQGLHQQHSLGEAVGVYALCVGQHHRALHKLREQQVLEPGGRRVQPPQPRELGPHRLRRARAGGGAGAAA